MIGMTLGAVRPLAANVYGNGGVIEVTLAVGAGIPLHRGGGGGGALTNVMSSTVKLALQAVGKGVSICHWMPTNDFGSTMLGLPGKAKSAKRTTIVPVVVIDVEGGK